MREGATLFQYICEHLVPGCTYKSSALTEEETHDIGKDHLHESHQIEYVDDEAWETIAKAVMPIPH